MKVSASKLERWSYCSGSGMAICWSGPVTVWSGMYDMVLVLKCSMAWCSLARVEEEVASESAHARNNSYGAATRKARPRVQWQARGSGSRRVVVVNRERLGLWGWRGGEMRQGERAEKMGDETACALALYSEERHRTRPHSRAWSGGSREQDQAMAFVAVLLRLCDNASASHALLATVG